MSGVLRINSLVMFLIWCFFFIFSVTEKEDVLAYPEHLIGPFTGGFGETTCHSCHFDYDLNWEEGSLKISGLSEKIISNKWYSVTVQVYREDIGRAGFQLSSRDQFGRQAGVFKISENERVMLTEKIPDSLQFVQHSKIGIEPLDSKSNQWTVEWKAPSVIPDTLYFNVSANAANGDDSEFGDWIYSKEILIKKIK